MAKVRGPVRLASLWAATVVAAACNPTTSTEYGVTGTLVSNSCGDGPWTGTPATSWAFSVGLSDKAGAVIWTPADGTAPLSAQAVGTAVALSGSSNTQDALDDGGMGPCAIDLATSIELAFDGGASDGASLPTVFTGTFSYTWTPIAGANCGGELMDGGGLYAQFPCTAEYTLLGVEQ